MTADGDLTGPARDADRTRSTAAAAGDRASSSVVGGADRASSSAASSTDRAVSDTVGFVLAFALVTATIGVVYTTGFSGLQDARRAEQIDNVERAFDVLADNLEDVHRRGAPSRATELKVVDGALRTTGSTQITIRAVNTSNSSQNATFISTPEPIVFVSDTSDTNITYASGAVFRSGGGNSLLLEPPGWTLGADRAIIPFVETYPERDRTRYGTDGTLLIVGRRTSRGLAGSFYAGGADVNVTVTVNSPRADAWKRYFESREVGHVVAAETDLSADVVTFRFETTRLYVPETAIEVRVRT